MDEIVRKTSSLGELVIKQVSKELAKEMIIRNHYSHKWNDGGFGKYNFGIFRKGDERCLGGGGIRIYEKSKGWYFHASKS